MKRYRLRCQESLNRPDGYAFWSFCDSLARRKAFVLSAGQYAVKLECFEQGEWKDVSLFTRAEQHCLDFFEIDRSQLIRLLEAYRR